MSFALWPAFWAGVVGGGVMVMARLALQRGLGLRLRLDVLRLWGTWARVHGPRAPLAGLLVHLAGSGLIALLFAQGFARLGVQDGLWLWGLYGGVILYVIAGLFMGAMPAMHPDLSKASRGPGLFVLHCGLPDSLVFLAGHLLFGVVVGVTYAWLHPQAGLAAAF